MQGTRHRGSRPASDSPHQPVAELDLADDERQLRVAKALRVLLARMQAAAFALQQQPRFDWGQAEQTRDALQYLVYAAFKMGVISEDEARELGFPV